MEQRQQIKLRWWQILIAIVLILLSMISKLVIFGVEITGGATIAAIAALILLWPFFHELAARGGSTKFLGLELQINSLEKRTEQDYALRIEELRADIEEMRKEIGLNLKSQSITQESLQNEVVAEKILVDSINKYRNFQAIDKWRERAEVDRQLIAVGDRLSADRLEQILSEAANDRETGMAVAVSLGITPLVGDDKKDAVLLAKLMQFRSERIRYRAAKSAARRGRRSDITQEARSILAEGVLSALEEEKAPDVIKALEEACKILALPK